MPENYVKIRYRPMRASSSTGSAGPSRWHPVVFCCLRCAVDRRDTLPVAEAVFDPIDGTWWLARRRRSKSKVTSDTWTFVRFTDTPDVATTPKWQAAISTPVWIDALTRCAASQGMTLSEFFDAAVTEGLTRFWKEHPELDEGRGFKGHTVVAYSGGELYCAGCRARITATRDGLSRYAAEHPDQGLSPYKPQVEGALVAYLGLNGDVAYSLDPKAQQLAKRDSGTSRRSRRGDRRPNARTAMDRRSHQR